MITYPADIPSVSAAQLSWSRQFSFERAPLNVTFGEQSVELEVAPSDGQNGGKPQKWVRVDFGDAVIFLGIDLETLSKCLQADYAEGADDLLLLVLHALSQPILDQLPHQYCEMIWREPNEVSADCEIAIRWTANTSSGQIALRFDMAASQAIATKLEALFQPYYEMQAFVPASVDVGSVWMDQDQLLDLEVGDLVVIGEGNAPRNFRVVIADKYEAPVKLKNGEVHLLTNPGLITTNSQEAAAMAKDNTAEKGTGSLVNQEDLQQMPVRLDFGLGEIEIPANALGEIGKGHVFDLGLEPTTTVKIRLGGRIIGLGEIISLNGSHGVRITKRC